MKYFHSRLLRLTACFGVLSLGLFACRNNNTEVECDPQQFVELMRRNGFSMHTNCLILNHQVERLRVQYKQLRMMKEYFRIALSQVESDNLVARSRDEQLFCRVDSPQGQGEHLLWWKETPYKQCFFGSNTDEASAEHLYVNLLENSGTNYLLVEHRYSVRKDK